MQIKGDAEGVQPDGVTKFTLSNQTVDNVLGIMMDIDTLGIVPIDQWSALEPLNARLALETVGIITHSRHLLTLQRMQFDLLD